MPEYVIAGLWGLLSGSGLLVGAIVADALFGKEFGGGKAYACGAAGNENGLYHSSSLFR